MMPRDLTPWLFTRAVIVVAYVMLGLGLLLACAEIARADDGRELAVVGYHEAGPDVVGDELAALWAVATRVPRRAPMRVQCRRLFEGRTPRAAEALRVRRNDPRFAGLLAVADAVVRGEIRHRCDGEPIAWGMRSGVDLRRALSFGWRRLDCGEGVRNFVWARRAIVR